MISLETTREAVKLVEERFFYYSCHSWGQKLSGLRRQTQNWWRDVTFGSN